MKTRDSAEDSECTSSIVETITDEIRPSIAVTLLNKVINLLEDVKKYFKIKTKDCIVEEEIIVTPVDEKPVDCAEVKEKNSRAPSGVYKVWLEKQDVIGPVEVYCDMEDDGGGWTVLQRRGDFGSGTDYFYKDWQSYKNGFGDVTKDFWIGNDNIYALTNEKPNIAKFTLIDWEKNQVYATYNKFWIEDEIHKYIMHVSGYNGTAGDDFSFTNERPFGTKDRHNGRDNMNCAVMYEGAWWFKSCLESHLNGMYLKGAQKKAAGLLWKSFKGMHYSLKDTEIKIRPKSF